MHPSDDVQPPEKAAAAVADLEQQCERIETPCGDGSLVWRAFGTGPSVALLHGGFGSWLHWFHTIEPLAKDYRLLLPDLPGLGDSADAPAPYDGPSIAAIVADGLASLVDSGDPLHIAGFSFGGVIGGHAAALLGERATSMTFVGSGGMGLTRPLRRQMVSWRAAKTPQEVMDAHRHNLAALMLEQPESIDELALYIQWYNTIRARTKSAPISMRATLAEVLPGIPARLAGIWGELDITSTGHLDERGEYLRDLQPEAPFEVIPDAGHWVMYEAPQAFEVALRRVLLAHG